jgi:hypothetical protein
VNVLGLLPARIRQALYIVYGALVIVYGAVDAAYLINPAWLGVAERVLVSLAVPFAALAATHVTPTSGEAASATIENLPVRASDAEDRD